MLMSWIFTGLVCISLAAALLTGNGSALAAAIPKGAQAGITLAISLAGSLCLWTGVGALMERIGWTGGLSKLLSPVLSRLFPSTRQNKALAGSLSANVCANILGLGNAATPMGIQAAQIMAAGGHTATDELCRLIVLNTASIQLIPSTVAALRVSHGCGTPFDILPCVWLTSILSAGIGLCSAWLLGKVWKHA